ncbi:xanthine dehydrogenase family protein molybdopterin-binding subunit [Chitinophaga horti]|uniref:Xanthine dehydrogenase family protein molybdopterin-binding subunit n=1 Tax=Chitinophaga horti TaxID=2920382 RepID=A0ABY6J5I1_9BACT|nr:xanthine dehydrogenase family protein molybdopterin-binding subunit [Chitinophaga horti]UYQ94935.1 xanthine dehydrogenase family protein molybdopterin-binding subunit [Chitinophaga horti]
MTNNHLSGKPVARLEGPDKVSGIAKYAGEYPAKGLRYGYVVNSIITKGKIKKIDTAIVEAIPGIIKVFTHENRPSLAWFNQLYSDMDAPPGAPFRPLHDENISFNGQPIALVVAESFELARYGASILHIEYEQEAFHTNLQANLQHARKPKAGLASVLKPPPPKPSGDFEKAYAKAKAQTSATFTHGYEHHNPMELFATTVVYEGPGKLTVYDKTQGTINSQLYIGNVFGLHYKNIRVISPYVGGAFGSGLRPQYQLFFAVLAALELKAPVRVTLDRQQMFTFGFRPPTIQHTRYGAAADGKVTAINHEAVAITSRFEDYIEVVVNWANMLYPAQNTLLKHQLVPLDVYTPVDMRAPGGSTGVHAVESTMDALSYQLGIDPVEFRLINYSDTDATKDKPYSSKELRQCYKEGALRFGWNERQPLPRSMRRGNRLVGYGMATGIWDVFQFPARAEASLTKAGKLRIKSAVTDIGTGTYTVMAQVAADELGLPLDQVEVLYGDSALPFSAIQGGSATTASVAMAIRGACEGLRKQLIRKAKSLSNSPLADAKPEEIIFTNGQLVLKHNPALHMTLADIAAANNGKPITSKKFTGPDLIKWRKYSRAAHSVSFVELEVDEDLGTVDVTRALTMVAAGRIINPKTARSQIIGSMVWGISKALREESIMDHRYGRFMNANLAEYHLPVHADVHDLEVHFVEEKDDIINELGIKGVGEVGLTAMPPAIANAIFHATGRRINKFPIKVEDLLSTSPSSL